MRSQVIPAQITTVEDKIAGNLSLSQIMLLLSPVLIATFIYAFLPPTMMLVWYKLALALFFVVVCLTLAIRVKGRIIASWLVVLLRYNARPKYYVYNKNSIAYREIIEPELLVVAEVEEELAQNVNTARNISPIIKDILQLNHILDTTDFNLTYRAGKKGGLNVAFEKIAR